MKFNHIRGRDKSSRLNICLWYFFIACLANAYDFPLLVLTPDITSHYSRTTSGFSGFLYPTPFVAWCVTSLAIGRAVIVSF